MDSALTSIGLPAALEIISLLMFFLAAAWGFVVSRRVSAPRASVAR